MITLKVYAPGVPYWDNNVVHFRPSAKQKEFYEILKKRFFKGEYIDLEGNTNYAHIFFTEFMNELLKHKHLSKIENHLEVLGQCYPAITGYAPYELIRYLEKIGDLKSMRRFENNRQSGIFKSWRLGSRYKSALKLSGAHVHVLDHIWRPNNSFTNIDYCCREVIKLYVKTIDELKNIYTRGKTTIEDEFNFIADLVVRKVYRHKVSDPYFKESLSGVNVRVYETVFELCENVVRTAYDYNSELYADFYSSTPKIGREFDNRVRAHIEKIHAKLAAGITPLDEATAVRLYSHSFSRWKRASDRIIADFNGDVTTFVDQINRLALLNRNNPAVEEIYLKASGFITAHDRQAALSFYVQYIHSGLRLRKFEKKPLTKKAQKVLFTSNAQVGAFEAIVKDLTKSKDLPNAIDAVASFYGPRRTEIKLSKAAIEKVRKRHSGTVELLSEYLRDEDDLMNDVQPKATQHGADRQQSNATVNATPSSIDSKLSTVQHEFLELFRKKGFVLPLKGVDAFAKSKKVFKNQLIDSINDVCYETLDDVLIEEDAGKYIINPDYFQRITTL